MSVLQYCTVLYDVQCASRTVNDVLCVWLFILFVVLIVVCLQSCLHQTVNAFCAPNSFRGKRSISILSRPPPPYKCVCVCEWSSGRVFCSVPPSSLSLLIDYTVLLLSLLISLPFLLKKNYQHYCTVLLFASSSFSLRRSHTSRRRQPFVVIVFFSVVMSSSTFS
jgi:hypothetical protein